MNKDSTPRYVRIVWGESAQLDNPGHDSCRAPTAAKLWQLYMSLPVCKDRLRWVRWAWQSWPCRPAGRSGDSFQSASGGRGGCAGPAGESGAQSCTGGCWPACNTRTQLGVGQARRGQGQVFRVAGYNFFKIKVMRKWWHQKKFLDSWVSEWWIFVLCLIFMLFLPVWIRIHKVAEYGSNLDLDTQHWLQDSHRKYFDSTGIRDLTPLLRYRT